MANTRYSVGLLVTAGSVILVEHLTRELSQEEIERDLAIIGHLLHAHPDWEEVLPGLKEGARQDTLLMLSCSSMCLDIRHRKRRRNPHLRRPRSR